MNRPALAISAWSLLVAGIGTAETPPAGGVASSGRPEVRAEVREDWRRQYRMLLDEHGRLLPTEEALRAVAAHPQATQPLPGDRTPVDIVLRRTAALLEDVRARGAAGTDGLTAEWEALRRETDGRKARERKPAPDIAQRKPSSKAGGVRATAAATPLAVVEDDIAAGDLLDGILADESAALERKIEGRAVRETAPSVRTPALEEGYDAGDPEEYGLYERACALRRKVVCGNPLLDMDRILFVTGGFHWNLSNHHAPGASGKLLVLQDPFGAEPSVVEPLAGVAVENGRYQGTNIEWGCFADPEVSWDGRTLYFAWSEKPGKPRCAVQEGYTEESTYHIFRADLDPAGKVTRLRQLTDGAWNDTDPCESPNGRIVFCSGRRGTTIRCNYDGGYAINNTLFSMEPDGSDVIWLSRHETGEWDPSVSHDGMLVYSRWDYVDRSHRDAHNLWTCYPDGRDPRAPHGNYPLGPDGGPGASKWPDCVPDAEFGIRAVPDRAGLFSAGTASRYTRAGTVILMDLTVPDDRRLSQVRVVTPDQPYATVNPEAFAAAPAACCLYASPWPLSERHFLAAVAEQQLVKAIGKGKEVRRWQRTRHGLYYVDVFGNRELLYDAGRTECMDPIPLRARARPPVIPEMTTQTARAGGHGDAASILVLNVYESDFAWPEGTRIERLRIVQMAPKTTGRVGPPKIGNGYAEQGPRFPLGTVPVHEDGSVWFEAPVGREIFFQALDAQGRAVQSMRSGTYVHPGERLVCAGCHEDKRRTRMPSGRTALALRRGKPSPIEPDVIGPDGAFEVLTFARHVQPVLDRRCADCHRKQDPKRAPALHDRTIDPRSGWSNSYKALVSRTFSYGSPEQDYSRTTAGRFGALAAPLTRHFTAAHHEAKIAPEEWRTVVAWLDCLAPFYGWDWDLEGQQRGENLVPRIDFDPANSLSLDRPAAQDRALLVRWIAEIRELQESLPAGRPASAATGGQAGKPDKPGKAATVPMNESEQGETPGLDDL
jgi:hypothetical protein